MNQLGQSTACRVLRLSPANGWLISGLQTNAWKVILLAHRPSGEHDTVSADHTGTLRRWDSFSNSFSVSRVIPMEAGRHLSKPHYETFQNRFRPSDVRKIFESCLNYLKAVWTIWKLFEPFELLEIQILNFLWSSKHQWCHEARLMVTLCPLLIDLLNIKYDRKSYEI